MFDGGVLDVEGVRRVAAALARVGDGCSDPEAIDRIRALEELKSAAAAAQAVLAAALDASVRAAHAARGLPTSEQGRGVAAQVALARRESPHRGGRHLGFAKAMVHEMPHTFAALRDGILSEWRATLLVRETACLTVEDRGVVDKHLCADPAALEGVGDRRLVAMAKTLAYEHDRESVARRRSTAERDRRVTFRPAPDTMLQINALVPVTDGVAVQVALTEAVNAAKADGDPRTRGQVMADTFVARVTGRDPLTEAPKIAVRIVMTDRTLLAGSDEPAFIPGYGPVPADLARDLLARAENDLRLRRLFTHPATGELIAMDARSRCYPNALRELIELRDQTCRTPWCDAPIRHIDHATPAARGGPTDTDNGQGLCERCNYDKQAPDWDARPTDTSRPGRHAIETTTPTGHTYVSRPPPLPGAI